MLKDVAQKYYFDKNYNCAETIIRAANEYYDLGITDRDMIMMAAFGKGVQTGNNCGALLAMSCVLSLKVVETRAHETPDLTPLCQGMVKEFKNRLGGIDCKEVNPKNFKPGIRCLHTVEAACDILEETITAVDKRR